MSKYIYGMLVLVAGPPGTDATQSVCRDCAGLSIPRSRFRVSTCLMAVCFCCYFLASGYMVATVNGTTQFRYIGTFLHESRLQRMRAEMCVG